jgi:two-component system capsular synthesis response regulator RcsB
MSETRDFNKILTTRVAPMPAVRDDGPTRINICTLDSHSAVRFGLECKVRTQYDMNWIGSGKDFREVAALLKESPCDVVIVEYQLEGLENDGWNLIKQFRRNFPDTRLLIYTGYMSPIRELGFASWQARFHGERKHPKTPDIPLDDVDATPEPSGEALEGAGLSTREMEVVRCLLQGMSVSEISHKFVRSIKTISSQKQAAFRKLSVSSNQDLFRLQKSFHIG